MTEAVISNYMINEFVNKPEGQEQILVEYQTEACSEETECISVCLFVRLKPLKCCTKNAKMSSMERRCLQCTGNGAIVNQAAHSHNSPSYATDFVKVVKSHSN